jgi:hypothetical protein
VAKLNNGLNHNLIEEKTMLYLQIQTVKPTHTGALWNMGVPQSCMLGLLLFTYIHLQSTPNSQFAVQINLHQRLTKQTS